MRVRCLRALGATTVLALVSTSGCGSTITPQVVQAPAAGSRAGTVETTDLPTGAPTTEVTTATTTAPSTSPSTAEYVMTCEQFSQLTYQEQSAAAQQMMQDMQQTQWGLQVVLPNVRAMCSMYPPGTRISGIFTGG